MKELRDEVGLTEGFDGTLVMGHSSVVVSSYGIEIFVTVWLLKDKLRIWDFEGINFRTLERNDAIFQELLKIMANVYVIKICTSRSILILFLHIYHRDVV